MVANESASDEEEQKATWDRNIVNLDTAFLSMLGEEEVSINTIPDVLDIVLQSSLWQRRLNRHEENVQVTFTTVLQLRAKHIWSTTTSLQRKGYYLAGVGLETGQKLDAIALQANALLINANAYIVNDDQQKAITAITTLAAILFDIPPFTPNLLPDDWRLILEAWLKGEALREHDVDSIDDTLKFVEDGLVYRLPWGLDALRVRAEANEDEISKGMTIGDFEVDLLVPAIENGTLNRCAAMLMQAGFSSRLEAINSIQSTAASFSNSHELKDWLSSDALQIYITNMELISDNIAILWKAFIYEYKPSADTIWEGSSILLPVNWNPGVTVDIGQLVKLHNEDAGVTKVLGSDGEIIGGLRERYNLLKNGIYRSQVEANGFLQIVYWGAGNSPFEYQVI